MFDVTKAANRTCGVSLEISLHVQCDQVLCFFMLKSRLVANERQMAKALEVPLEMIWGTLRDMCGARLFSSKYS